MLRAIFLAIFCCTFLVVWAAEDPVLLVLSALVAVAWKLLELDPRQQR